MSAYVSLEICKYISQVIVTLKLLDQEAVHDAPSKAPHIKTSAGDNQLIFHTIHHIHTELAL